MDSVVFRGVSKSAADTAEGVCLLASLFLCKEGRRFPKEVLSVAFVVSFVLVVGLLPPL